MWLLIAVILLGSVWWLDTLRGGGPWALTVGLLGLAWGIIGFFRRRARRVGPRPRQIWVRRQPVTTSWDSLPLRALWQRVGPTPPEVELNFDPRPTREDDPYLDS
jgi:hypothetical protein